jgi:adenylate cyclase
LAEAGGICISRTAYDQVKKKLEFGYEYLGEHNVKNLSEPVHVYRVLMEPEAAGKVIGEKRFLGKISRRSAIAAIIILIVVAVGLAGWNLYLRQSKRLEPASFEKMAFPLPDKPSIAVLPFDNLTGDPDQEYFSDGITEEIITALSKTPKLLVIARNSTFTYKGKPVKVQQVAEELGVQYILEGSVRKVENRIRITAQLIDAIKGYHIWSERYDRELKDVFILQDEITMRIITALQVELTDGEQAHVFARGTENLQAYLKYLEAREHAYRVSKDGMIMARKALKEGFELDPEYGYLYLQMGWIHLHDATWGWSKSREKDLKLAYELAQKALALNAPKAEVYMLMSGVHLRKKELKETIALREKAVALQPNHAYNNGLLAIALTYGGRSEEAIPIYKKAMRLDPFPAVIFINYLGHAYRLTEQYEKAIEAFKTATSRDRDFWLSHWGLTVCYGLLGREDEARTSAAEVLRIRPDFSLAKASGFPYKDKADEERCLEVLRKAGLK